MYVGCVVNVQGHPRSMISQATSYISKTKATSVLSGLFPRCCKHPLRFQL